MDTGHFIEPKEIVQNAAMMAGDREFKKIPKGFYYTWVRDAFRDLNMSTLFMDAREDFEFPYQTLTLNLPVDCIDVTSVYVFTGDRCTIASSRKVWWKRNYYTNGNGYIANNKYNNGNDPYLQNATSLPQDKSLIRAGGDFTAGNVLWYEIEGGRLMLSSSCRSVGTKVHIKYKSSGSDMMDAPIIPLFYKSAIQDFVIEAALLARCAGEPVESRALMSLADRYTGRLDKDGFNGSWHQAKMLAKTLTNSKMDDLKTYLGKAAWATGR